MATTITPEELKRRQEGTTVRVVKTPDGVTDWTVLTTPDGKDYYFAGDQKVTSDIKTYYTYGLFDPETGKGPAYIMNQPLQTLKDRSPKQQALAELESKVYKTTGVEYLGNRSAFNTDLKGAIKTNQGKWATLNKYWDEGLISFDNINNKFQTDYDKLFEKDDAGNFKYLKYDETLQKYDEGDVIKELRSSGALDDSQWKPKLADVTTRGLLNPDVDPVTGAPKTDETGQPVSNKVDYTQQIRNDPEFKKIYAAIDASLAPGEPKFGPEQVTEWQGKLQEAAKPFVEQGMKDLGGQYNFINPQGYGSGSQAKALQEYQTGVTNNMMKGASDIAWQNYVTDLANYSGNLGKKIDLETWLQQMKSQDKNFDWQKALGLMNMGWQQSMPYIQRQWQNEDKAWQADLAREMAAAMKPKESQWWEYVANPLLGGLGMALGGPVGGLMASGVGSLFGKKLTTSAYNPTSLLNIKGYNPYAYSWE